MWQKSEALGDHRWVLRKGEDVFNDLVETVALKPMERRKHDLTRSVNSSLVYVHCHKSGQ
jgi:hypothetical protein